MTLERVRPFFKDRKNVFLILIAVLWLALVIFAVSRHEFWRDEVRDLSIARSVSSPFDLVAATQNEGHPLLWYLLLFAAKSVIDQPWVLPAVSILVSFGAVLVLLFFSPFKIWLKCLVIFSALVLFENTVMARPYGLSFLLLAIIAVLLHDPHRHPLWLGFLLALLANANLHSAVLAGLIGAAWFIDWIITNRKTPRTMKTSWRVWVASGIVAAGLALCAYTVLPRGNSLFLPLRANLTFEKIVASALISLARPDLNFAKLMPAFVPTVVLVGVYYIALLGFLGKPKLLIFLVLAQMAFGVLFQTVYPPSARHQGVFLVFIVFLYWLFLDSSKTAPARKFHFAAVIGIHIGLAGLLLGSLVQLKDTLLPDLAGQSSSSAALGNLLKADPLLQNAIIVPEPDYLMDALPYYGQNPIYYPRENRFGTYVSWTLDSRETLSMAELIDQARQIKQSFGQSVVIVLGFPPEVFQTAGQIEFSYNKTFTWSATDLDALITCTRPITRLDAAYGDENYTLYWVE